MRKPNSVLTERPCTQGERRRETPGQPPAVPGSPPTIGDLHDPKSRAVSSYLTSQQHWTLLVAPTLKCFQLQGPTCLSFGLPGCSFSVSVASFFLILWPRTSQCPGAPAWVFAAVTLASLRRSPSSRLHLPSACQGPQLAPSS